MKITAQTRSTAQAGQFLQQLKSALDMSGAGGQTITGAEANTLIGPSSLALLSDSQQGEFKDFVHASVMGETPWQLDSDARQSFADYLQVDVHTLPAAFKSPQLAGLDTSALQAASKPSHAAQQALGTVPPGPPSTNYAQQSGVLDLMQAQGELGQNMPLPAAQYFNNNELQTNLNETYGPGSAGLMMQAEMSIVQAQMALMLALQGASTEQISAMLGDSPQAQALASKISRIVELLFQAPPDLQSIQQAVMDADASLVNYAAPQPGPQREAVQRLFREQYGVNQSGGNQTGANSAQTAPHGGRGAFGNPLHERGVGKIPDGSFSNGTGTAGAKAIAAARSQVGVREASGRNDGVPAQRYANGRREPWCADFVAWSFRQSGQPLPGNQRSLASVQYMENQMKKSGRFQRGTPKAGDIIFFANRGRSDRGGGRHVGIVDRVENGRVYTIEGNSGNRVAKRSYAMNNARISGYGRA